MCGRFILTSPVESLAKIFGFSERPNLAPRYNIAPTQEVPIVRRSPYPAADTEAEAPRSCATNRG